jgi:hypothetical protein
MDEDLKRYLDARFHEIDRKFAELRPQFKEDLERVETTLLTEFHKWASPVEMRARSHAAAIRALDIEVETLGDRLKKLEDRPS